MHLGLGCEVGGLDWNKAIRPGPLEIGFDESFILPVTNDRVPTVYVKGHYVHNLSEEDDRLLVRYPEEGHHEYQEARFWEYDEATFEPLVGNLPTGLNHPELLQYPADEQHSGTVINEISLFGHMDGGQSAWWNDEDMAYELTQRSKAFTREHQETPFFLYLSMHENHVPRLPHPDFIGTSGTGLRGDAVVELDWVVGQVVELLNELDLREEALIIFTSDNGPVLYEGYEALEDHK